MFYLYTHWMNRWPLKYTGSLSFPFDKFVYYLFSLCSTVTTAILKVTFSFFLSWNIGPNCKTLSFSFHCITFTATF